MAGYGEVWITVLKVNLLHDLTGADSWSFFLLESEFAEGGLM